MKRVRAFSALIAPVLLCAVALVQLYAARTGWLTAWKGGGFGMFSTVDSPAVRFLRIELETDHGSVRVTAPGRLQRDALKLREAPDEKALRAFVDKLAAGTWIEDEPVPAETSYALMMDVVAGSSPVQAPRDTSRGKASIYRMLQPGDSRRNPPLNVRSVCAEVWRYRVERQTTRLVADRLIHACAAAPHGK